MIMAILVKHDLLILLGKFGIKSARSLQFSGNTGNVSITTGNLSYGRCSGSITLRSGNVSIK